MKRKGIPVRLACAALPLVLFLRVVSAAAQQTAIDPNWVYVTPIAWKHAPAGIPERAGFASVAVLFPDGRYFEIRASLIQMDKTKLVSFSLGDGTLYRGGTWSRVDDDLIRIHSRDTWKDNLILGKNVCDPGGKNCQTLERPIPGPFTDETCALEGESKTHLARIIQCRSFVLKATELHLDMKTLAIDAGEEAHHLATSGKSGNTP